MKRHVWAIVLLPLLGILLFYFFSAPSVQNKQAESRLGEEITRHKVSKSELDSKMAQSEIKVKRFLEGSDERLRVIEKNLAEAAKTMTPELQRKIVDFSMRNQEPRYLDLFESWGIDSATMAHALYIINERNIKLMELRTEALKGGRSQLSEYEKKSKAVAENVEKQMVEALGEVRFAEFSRFESKTINPQKAPSKAPSDD